MICANNNSRKNTLPQNVEAVAVMERKNVNNDKKFEVDVDQQSSDSSESESMTVSVKKDEYHDDDAAEAIVNHNKKQTENVAIPKLQAEQAVQIKDDPPRENQQ